MWIVKIARVESWTEAIPLSRPYTIAFKSTSEVELPFVRVTADNGQVGLGSASPVVQITGESLTGTFGPACRKSAEWMLKNGLVHVLASDAHWANERPPVLSGSLAAAAGIVGEEKARTLVLDTPRAILDGGDLE